MTPDYQAAYERARAAIADHFQDRMGQPVILTDEWKEANRKQCSNCGDIYYHRCGCFGMSFGSGWGQVSQPTPPTA